MAFSSADAIADRLGLQAIADGARLLPPSWNVAPTNQIRIIVPADSNGRGFEMPLSGSSTDGNALRGSSTDGLALEVARWGLQPPWSKKGSGLINSRIETAVEKPVFASAFAKRRCIVPVDGYYEWQKLPDGKQPWFISGPNQMLYFAGIYNIGQNEKNVAILTMPTAPDIADIHHRMPVSFQPDDFSRWLTGGTPETDQHFTRYPVSTMVNSVRNNGSGLITPIELTETELTLF